jgi:hypothetical protein
MNILKVILLSTVLTLSPVASSNNEKIYSEAVQDEKGAHFLRIHNKSGILIGCRLIDDSSNSFFFIYDVSMWYPINGKYKWACGYAA